MIRTIAQFHCTIMKMEIFILYHVIVNSNLIRFYVVHNALSRVLLVGEEIQVIKVIKVLEVYQVPVASFLM